MTLPLAKKSLITLLMTLALTTADVSVNGTCNPSKCSAECTPSCSSGQTCVLTTMSNCAVCPASKCINPTAIGIIPTTTSSSNSKSNNGPMIGGIVGGLLGLGLVLGLGVYCFFKRSKSSGKLPFMFTANSNGARRSYLFNNNNNNNNNYNNNSQIEKPMTPNPAVIAAIAQRTDTSRQYNYITMSDIQSMSSSASTQQQQQQQQEQQEPTRPPTSYNSNSMMSPHHQRLSKLIVENRQSIISTNSSELSEDDQHSIASSSHTPKSVATVQAVQVTRAKPQIMRVNSIKSTNGINRSGSVRTILTAVEDEDVIENPFKDSEYK